MVLKRNGNDLSHKKNGMFFERKIILRNFVFKRKIVISVIACVNNFELFTTHRVLLSISSLSSMKVVVVNFNT